MNSRRRRRRRALLDDRVRDEPVFDLYDVTTPSLLISNYAWQKLRFLRDIGSTEIGGFAILSKDLQRIDDIRLVRQRAYPAFVELDDEGVADFYDECVDAGYAIEQFARCWVHTHPGTSPHPSGPDEMTFSRCFGQSSWAIMLIVARNDATYARVAYNIGPKHQFELAVRLDHSDSGNFSLDVDELLTEYYIMVQTRGYEQWYDQEISNLDGTRDSPTSSPPNDFDRLPSALSELERWDDSWYYS